MTVSTHLNYVSPVMQWTGKGDEYQLIEDYTFQWVAGVAIKRITIKAGSTWNRADVPFPIRWLVPQDKGMEGPSLVHDILCREKGVLKPTVAVYEICLGGVWRVDNTRWKRWEADDLCGYMAKCAGVKLHAGVAPALKVWPVNWFKMF